MSDLPAGFSVRRPTLADVPAILAVIHASDVAAIGYADFTSDEIVETLQAPNHDPDRDSWVVEDGTGRLVGWAFLENPTAGEREHFDAYVDPDRGRPAQPYLVDLVLARAAERATEFGHDQITLRGGAIGTEEEYVELLLRRGFAFIKRYARMSRDLSDLDSKPEISADVTIRPVHADNDAEMRIFHDVIDSAFRDTPDYQPADYDTFRARLAALPGIDWDEWFVAEVDGAIVGALMSSRQSGEQNEGWVKNLAVVKAYRHRGLGRLLLLTAFATYAAKGRVAVGLGVDMTNPTGAYRLYESAGMTPAYEADIYERTIPAAPPPR